MAKKLILALLGLTFAFAVASCDDHAKKPKDGKKKCQSEKSEKHHERW